MYIPKKQRDYSIDLGNVLHTLLDSSVILTVTSFAAVIYFIVN
jgi:hypothetical protein